MPDSDAELRWGQVNLLATGMEDLPYWCDSGKRHIDCHQADDLDEPCECESGKTFRDCCMVVDRTAVPDVLWSAPIKHSWRGRERHEAASG